MCAEKPVCACLLRQEVSFPHGTTVLGAGSLCAEKSKRNFIFYLQRRLLREGADNAIGFPCRRGLD